MKMKMIITANILILILTGCSVYKASSQPGEKDLSVLHKGAIRDTIISELGRPIHSEKISTGRMDIYKFNQGYSTATKTSRAMLHGTADVFTLGLWEIIGTPVESAFDGTKVRLKVNYDKRDKLESIKVLSDNLEIENKEEMLDTKKSEILETIENFSNELTNVNAQYSFKKNEKVNYDSFALVVGINEYKQNTNVEFADLSALAFAELANTTLGVPKENIIPLTNEQATSGQLKAKIELIKELADEKGNIYVYFAGHGVPGKDGNTYMLPYDMSADSIYLEPNLQLDNIYAKLSKSNAKNIFVFMDSCFSGKDDKGGLLYKGVAPVLRTNNTVVPGSKLTVFTAGQSTDFANDYSEKKQRMFTYFLIEGLANGETNLNKIYPEIKSRVKRASLMKGIGYKQIPQIYGNKEQKLY